MLNPAIIESFIEILGHTNVSQNTEDLLSASCDNTEDLSYLPEILLFPENTIQVSEIIKICNKELLPTYTRGAGTGLSGGALPVKGGVVISTKKMNKILSIDPVNFQATVEPGVINAELKNALLEYNLTYPPDPASFESSTIGGNIAHGAGGPKAIKYGTTRDYVLNLEVVTGKGDIIWTGANTLKNSTGFALTHLMIGSEGLLGIVTKAVLKLVPKVENELLLLAAFRDSYSAASCVNQILLAGFSPVGIELMELEAVKISMEATKLNFPIPAEVQYYLLIILEGQNVSELELQSESIYEIISNFGAFEVYTPSNSDMANEWWKIRRSMGTAVKQISVYKEEDTVVPRGNLPQLLSGVKEIGQKYNFRSVCYGHAGDGNLHINILKDNLTHQQWTEEIPIAIREIFELCKSLGGTISGEHGIGLVQKPYLDIVISPEIMSIFQGIKNSFDPNRILNMGKWIS